MRVLHVIEAIEAGVARHVADLVSHVEAEHIVVVPPQRIGGFTDLDALERMEAAGAEVELTTMRRSPLSPQNARAILRVRRLIRRRDPAVVHGHAAIGGAVARIAAARSGVPCVYTPHAVLPARAAIIAERALRPLTARVVAVSASEATSIERLGVAAVDRIVTIPNGIPLGALPPAPVDLRAMLGREGQAVPLVGTIGRLAHQKAPEVFIHSCAAVARSSPDACFVLIGDGPLRDAVAAEVTASGLGDRFLHLPGLTTAAAVLPQLDVFVLCSRYEAGPYVPLEAMHAGTPVVLTDVGGCRELIDHDRSGLLVGAGDVEATAAAVERLLADRGLRARFSERAGERVRADFDVTLMAERVGRLYEQLASDRT